jgi:hypothetical protein
VYITQETSSTESSQILEPWLDLVDSVVDNKTFVDAVGVINNADMVRRSASHGLMECLDNKRMLASV